MRTCPKKINNHGGHGENYSVIMAFTSSKSLPKKLFFMKNSLIKVTVTFHFAGSLEPNTKKSTNTSPTPNPINKPKSTFWFVVFVRFVLSPGIS